MKNTFFCLVILCLPALLFSQAKSIEQFYNNYKDQKDVTSINLTGELINFVFSASDTETGEIASKISKIRVLLVEEKGLVSKSDYSALIKSVKKDKFEEFLKFKDGGDAVDFHLRDDGKVITDVLITVRGEDGFILLSLEGLFKYSDLNNFDLNIEGGQYLKKLPENSKYERA